MRSEVLFEREGAVAALTLNRPERLNALAVPMARELAGRISGLMGDRTTRCLVLRGAGGNFCAGGDVKEFRAQAPGAAPAYIRELTMYFHSAVASLGRLRMPVVASVAGVAAGGGFSLAAACDLVICADSARFAIAYAHIGLPPDGGLTAVLPRRIGYGRALELALLAPVLSAAEAERLGLANRVVAAADLERETAAWAGRLAAGPTEAFGRTKRLLQRSLDLERQMELERDAISDCARTQDFDRGIAALLERRSPRFEGD
jgi:2-(1,2-epoxy-1,2-dihydrophenyl)acetyl-CoA isomerase